MSPPMIDLLDAKHPDFTYVEHLLEDSARAGVWTNFGPVARRLEETAGALLALPPERAVVACASGTVALHALVSLHGFLAGRPLRWVVSAFTFACQRQGPLAEARVVDCAADGSLDHEAVDQLSIDDYDGIVVTHLFGGRTDADAWAAFAKERGKRLIFDSAAGFYSCAQSVGDGEAYSFHHTKPCGFGEGGCMVVAREHEDPLRSILNFGLYGGIDTGPFSMNGKLSDVAAAFILDRLRLADELRDGHREQWHRIASPAQELGFEILGSRRPEFPWLVALCSPRTSSPESLINDSVKLHKYYRPLDSAAHQARRLYERAVCWPSHPGMERISDREIRRLLQALAGS